MRPIVKALTIAILFGSPGYSVADRYQTLYFTGVVKQFDFTGPNVELPGLGSPVVGCIKINLDATNSAQPPLGQYRADLPHAQHPAILTRYGVRSRSADFTLRSPGASVVLVSNKADQEYFAFRGELMRCETADGKNLQAEMQASLEGLGVLKNSAPGALPRGARELRPAKATERNWVYGQCGDTKFAANFEIRQFLDKPNSQFSKKEKEECAR